MRSPTKTLTRAAAAALIALPAAATDRIDVPPKVTDGSHVTVEEIRANSGKLFDALAGADGGPIARDDFATRDLPEHLVAEESDREVLTSLFEVLDGDGDGQVTRAEWNRRIQADLAFADRNEDGRITLKELADARENLGLGEALGIIF